MYAYWVWHHWVKDQVIPSTCIKKFIMMYSIKSTCIYFLMDKPFIFLQILSCFIFIYWFIWRQLCRLVLSFPLQYLCGDFRKNFFASINQVFVAAKIWHCWECFVWFCRYEAGDHVAVYPVNDSELVDLIGKRLEVDLDQMFTLTNLDGGCRYLNVITLTLKDFKSLTLKKDAMYQKWIIPSERMLHVHFF